jgi:hypothetical protein
VKGPVGPQLPTAQEPSYVVPDLDLPSAEKAPELPALPRTPADEPLRLQSSAEWVEEQLASRQKTSKTPKISVGAFPPFLIQRFSEGSAFDVSVDRAMTVPVTPPGDTYELAPRASVARAAVRPIVYPQSAAGDPVRPAAFNWKTWRRAVASIGAVSAVAVAAGYPAMNGVILFVWGSTIFSLFQSVVHSTRTSSKP